MQKSRRYGLADGLGFEPRTGLHLYQFSRLAPSAGLGHPSRPSRLVEGHRFGSCGPCAASRNGLENAAMGLIDYVPVWRGDAKGDLWDFIAEQVDGRPYGALISS
jgi:hypothetical protein